MTGYTDKHL